MVLLEFSFDRLCIYLITGAIFPEYLTISQIAFQGAIKRANYFANKIQLKPIIRNVPEMDSLKAERAGRISSFNFSTFQIDSQLIKFTACELLSEGVHAIFGPSSNVTSGKLCFVYQFSLQNSIRRKRKAEN